MRRKTPRNESSHLITIRQAVARTLYCRSGLSGLALGALAFSGPLYAGDTADQTTPAPSADQTNQPLAEVVVTGIRASLQKSLDIKEQSIGVVDAISDEDIGQFPDASLGDAIARIPGVTVNRGTIQMTASAGAPSATGQVTSISVRGFGSQFDEILQEGRVVASGNGQSFDVGALGSEYVGEVDVLKTPDYSLSSGAIGATLNIKYPNPFDHPGPQARAYIAGSDYANDGQVSPAGGALFSDTFANDTIGFLVSFDDTTYNSNEDHFEDVGWKGTTLGCNQFAPGAYPAGSGCSASSPSTATSAVPSWYDQDQALYLEDTQSQRRDGRLAFQWHPSDNVLVTIDDNYSRDTEVQDRWQYSTWFGSGSFKDVTQDANGTITDFSYSAEPNGSPTDLNAFVSTTDVETNTPGLNVKWELGDHWETSLDAAQSVSRLNPNGSYTDVDADVGYGPSTAVGTNGYVGGLVVSPNTNILPYWTALGPNNNAANDLGLNPFIIGSHDFPIQDQQNTDMVNQVKLDATWHTEDTSVHFGAQFVEDAWHTKEYDNFTNNQWELWNGYGPASNNYTYYCGTPVTNAANECANQASPPAGAIQVVSGDVLPQSLFTPVSIANFINGYNTANLPQALVKFNPYSVLNYLITQPPNANWVPSAGYPEYAGGYPALALSLGSVGDVTRKNYAPFVTGQHDFALGGDMKLKVSVGLRYEETHTTITGLTAPLESLGVEAGDATAYVINLGSATPTEAHNNYGYFLPALDLNLLVTPDVKVRFDASRTETPPNNGQIIPNTTYGGRVNALTANGNNPDLLPYLSDNVDLGLEWYYGRNDYVSVDGFYKHVTQFPVSNITDVTVPGVINTSPLAVASSGSGAFGQPAIFAESTTTNGLEADVKGIETIWQQMLWLGFGFQVNGTWVTTNRNFDPYNLTTNQFALPGVGSSANFIGFYQNYGFQARLAVQWQADELLGLGQSQGGGAFGNEPVNLAANTEVDFSSSYQINPHFQIYFEALNLTDNVYHTYGRFPNQTLDVVDYGRGPFILGARFKL